MEHFLLVMSQRFLKLYTNSSPILIYMSLCLSSSLRVLRVLIRTTEEDVTHTDNKSSQQGDAEGDGEGRGLNTALFSSRNISVRYIREHV